MSRTMEGAQVPSTYAAHKAKIEAARTRGIAELAQRIMDRDAQAEEEQGD